jgi:hypothetical protein
MSQAAKAERPARPKAVPDTAPAPEAAAPAPAEKPAQRAPDGVTPPRVTSDDPWRDLHPARVWPD